VFGAGPARPAAGLQRLPSAAADTAAQMADRLAAGAADDDDDAGPAAIVELCARRGAVVKPTPASRQVAPIFLPGARAAAAKPKPGPAPGRAKAKPAAAAKARPAAAEPLREVTVLDRRDGRFYYVRADGTREPRDGAGAQ